MNKKRALFLALGLGLAPAAQTAPVLVELFTSQGCSSCPPAEGWLNGKGLELFQKGEIIPLAFHVDYWDYLGWKDPFSSPLWTDRQKLYASTLGDSSLYTPQMVVGGRVGFVGSDGKKALGEIANPANGTGSLAISLKSLPGKEGPRIQITTSPLPPGVKAWVAVFENGSVTAVARGENAGRSLEENFVVRAGGELVMDHPLKGGGAQALFDVGPSLPLDRTGVAVWVQQEATMKVLGIKCLFPLSSQK